MTKPEITHELHDSAIASVSTGPGQEASFLVDLYPVFYPDRPQIVLRFGGILNYEKVQQYVRRMETEADDDYIGCRIDCFQYDTKKPSKTNDYWFFLETDWCGPVRIHCSEMTITQVHYGSCKPMDTPEAETPDRQHRAASQPDDT